MSCQFHGFLRISFSAFESEEFRGRRQFSLLVQHGIEEVHRRIQIIGNADPQGCSPNFARRSGDRMVHQLNKDQALTDIKALEQIKTESMASNRLNSIMLGGFATVALLLSAIAADILSNQPLIDFRTRLNRKGCPMKISSTPQQLLMLAAGMSVVCWGQRKSAQPLDHLPPQIEVLTHFGERADISPDNSRIAFMDKSFGDAFVIDLKTRVIRCLTCSVPGAAFLRVMHFTSGDYLLIGPQSFSDIHESRTKDNQLWFLSKAPGSKPQPLGEKMSEGAAISKRDLKIAYSVTAAQDSSLAPEESRLFVADVRLANAGAQLTNKKIVYQSHSKACTIEAQDFYDSDKKMTFTCYEPNHLASVMSIDLETGKVENMSKAPGTYNECEGIYPDGLYTNVEADRQVEQLGGEHGSRNIDIWKLRLDGTGKNFERLTHFNDYEGFKASNPVVSTDGRFMAFQIAQTKDEAGVGYGIMLYHFR